MQPAALPPQRHNRTLLLAVVAALAVIVIWGSLAFFRVGPFKRIGGRLKIEALSAEQITGKAKIDKPTVQERQRYTEYAQRVKRYASVRMSGAERDQGSSLASLVMMQTKGETAADRDAYEARFKELSEGEAKVEGSVFGRVKSWFQQLAVVFAADPPNEEEEAYSAMLLNNVANIQIMQGQFYNPLLFAALAAISDPENPDVCVTTANLLKDANDLENALASIQYGLKLNPGSEKLLYTGGMILLEQGELQQAENYFMTAMNNAGGPGPSNQGMMLVSMARNDYPSAFLFMLEGGRDGFTKSIWDTYQVLRLKPNYVEMSGRIFDQYTLMELMDFKRCRTAFDPTLDTVRQQIQIDGNFFFPENINDFNHSAGVMTRDTIAYVKAVAKYYEEDARQLGEAFDILMAKDLKDAYARYKNSSLVKKEKTEAEKQVTWYQEEFWLCILNDYFQWENKKIEKRRKEDDKKFDKSFAQLGIHLDEIGEKYDKDMERSQKAEQAGNYIGAMMIMLPYMANIPSGSMLLPKDRPVPMKDLNDAIKGMSVALNRQYKDTKMLVEEYWLYSNAILGLIADDEIYNKYRSEQRNNAVMTISWPVMHAGFMEGILVGIGASPMMTAMIGGINEAKQGSATGKIPKAPVLRVSDKWATIEEMLSWKIKVPPNPVAAAKGALKDVEKPFLTDEEWEFNFQIYLKQHQYDVVGLSPEERVKLSSTLRLEAENAKREAMGLPPKTQISASDLCVMQRKGSRLLDWDCVKERDIDGEIDWSKGVGVGDYVVQFDETGALSSISTPNVAVESSASGRSIFIGGGPNTSLTLGQHQVGAQAGVGIALTTDQYGRKVAGPKASASASLSNNLSISTEGMINVAGGPSEAKLRVVLGGEELSSSWKDKDGAILTGMKYVWNSVRHPFGGDEK
jgi:Flp pilus assembly protein TadD